MVLYNNRTNDFDGGPTFELVLLKALAKGSFLSKVHAAAVLVHREGNDNPRNYSNQKLWPTNFWHVCMSSDTKLLEHRESREEEANLKVRRSCTDTVCEKDQKCLIEQWILFLTEVATWVLKGRTFPWSSFLSSRFSMCSSLIFWPFVNRSKHRKTMHSFQWESLKRSLNIVHVSRHRS